MSREFFTYYYFFLLCATVNFVARCVFASGAVVKETVARIKVNCWDYSNAGYLFLGPEAVL